MFGKRGGAFITVSSFELEVSQAESLEDSLKNIELTSSRPGSFDKSMM